MKLFNKTARSSYQPCLSNKQRGFTLIEILISSAIAALIMSGLIGVISLTLDAEDSSRNINDLTQQTRFAMQRMVTAISSTQRLMLPLADNPSTDWQEQLRVETVPASAPEGSSTKATAVLAVTLSTTIDRDGDGWADANNDKDFHDYDNDTVQDSDEPERIDEDVSDDNSNDNAAGIIGIDDDGNGTADDSSADDNDEDGSALEDSVDGVDNDNDGAIDEDITKDMNGDNQPGVTGVDDDYDTVVDEGGTPLKADDDEDGSEDEDWFDPVVYYLSGSDLIERMPSQTDTTGDFLVTGADFTENTIASNVSLFRVERLAQGSDRFVRVDLTLELNHPTSGETFSLQTQVRVGGGL